MAENTGKQTTSRSGPKKAKSKKTAAARAESNGGEEAKTVKWHKLVLDLPDALPETVMFDITDLEAGVQTDDPRPVFRLLRSVVGSDQFTAIRNTIESEQLSVGDEVIELMSEVLGAYGLSASESSASEQP